MQTFTVTTASGHKVKLPMPLNPMNILDNSEPRSIETCIMIVAEKYGISKHDLKSCGRRVISTPRQLAYLLARTSTGKSYPTIARAFNRDHSTVMHGVKKYLELTNTSPELKAEYDILLSKVGGAFKTSTI